MASCTLRTHKEQVGSQLESHLTPEISKVVWRPVKDYQKSRWGISYPLYSRVKGEVFGGETLDSGHCELL